MHKKLILANWKSHKTKSEVLAWLDHFATNFPKQVLADFELALAPSMPYLNLVGEYLQKLRLNKIKLTAQDVSQYPLGKYTGATAAVQLVSVGCRYVLIGHSERRRYFGETPQIVAQKIDQTLENGLQPIVCVDDDQIISQAQALTPQVRSQLIILYEPLSAIGTGMGQDVPAVTQAVAQIRQQFGQIRVIYGGSVAPHNISEYLMITDGVGVGTASLEVKEFMVLIEKLMTAN